jgi:hypothetical protein
MGKTAILHIMFSASTDKGGECSHLFCIFGATLM